jgi:hypothetical protein
MWAMVAQNGFSFLAKRRQAKNQAAWDRYHNAMVALQAAQAQNSVTDNVAINRAKHAENEVLIKKSRLMAAAKVTANAAASGVAGGAVETTLFDIGRNAGNKLASEDERMRVSLLASDQQRRGIAMQSKMGIKSVTQGPSLLSAVAGLGMSILDDQDTGPTSTGTTLGGNKRTQGQFSWDQLKTLMT